MRVLQSLSIIREQRGTTMVIALMVTAILSLLGASLLETGITELKISRNQENATRAFFLAEAGLQHAAAIFNRQGMDAARALAGNEHQLGDGTYRLAIEDLASGQSRIRVTATGTCRGSSRRLQAEFFRVLVDFRPAGAITILGNAPNIDLGQAPDPIIDGRDHLLPSDFSCAPERCEGELSGEAAAAGLQTPRAATIRGEGLVGEPPHSIGPPAASADHWRELSQILVADAGPEMGNLGSREAPAITLVMGEQTLDGALDGAGILVVDAGASLRIDGRFHYEGLILVLDGGRIDCSGTTDLFGGLILIGDGVQLNFQPRFRLHFSRQALAAIDRWLPAPYYDGTRLATWVDLNLL